MEKYWISGRHLTQVDRRHAYPSSGVQICLKLGLPGFPRQDDRAIVAETERTRGLPLWGNARREETRRSNSSGKSKVDTVVNKIL